MSLRKLTLITPAVFPFWKSKKFFKNTTSLLLQLTKESPNSPPRKKKKLKHSSESQSKSRKKFTAVSPDSTKSSPKTK
jgi:hypothetical protein